MQTLTCVSKTKLFTWIKKREREKKNCNQKRKRPQLRAVKRKPTDVCTLHRAKGQIHKKEKEKKGVLVLHMFSTQMHHNFASAHNPKEKTNQPNSLPYSLSQDNHLKIRVNEKKKRKK